MYWLNRGPGGSGGSGEALQRLQIERAELSASLEEAMERWEALAERDG